MLRIFGGIERKTTKLQRELLKHTAIFSLISRKLRKVRMLINPECPYVESITWSIKQSHGSVTNLFQTCSESIRRHFGSLIHCYDFKVVETPAQKGEMLSSLIKTIKNNKNQKKKFQTKPNRILLEISFFGFSTY